MTAARSSPSPRLPHAFERVAFLLSTGRTATTALADYLTAAYPTEVLAVHEPPPSRRLRVLSNKRACGRVTADAAAAAYARARGPLLARVRGPAVYVESSPFLHGFVDVLPHLFDRPRVVHLVRDPRTYVRSYINFGVFRGAKGLVGRWHPFWLLKPEHYEPASGRRWARMTPVARVAWYWTAINTLLGAAEPVYRERYTRVTFEALFGPDPAPVQALAGWIGLPARAALGRLRDKPVNASRGREVPVFDAWPATDRQALFDLCGPLMERYGYR